MPHSVVAKKGRLRECPPPIAGAFSRTQGLLHEPVVDFRPPGRRRGLRRRARARGRARIAAPLARAQADDPVVARVNGADIRQSDLALAEEDLGSNVPQMTPEAKRDYLVTFVADMMLVAKAAEARRSATATTSSASSPMRAPSC